MLDHGSVYCSECLFILFFTLKNQCLWWISIYVVLNIMLWFYHDLFTNNSFFRFVFVFHLYVKHRDRRKKVMMMGIFYHQWILLNKIMCKVVIFFLYFLVFLESGYFKLDCFYKHTGGDPEVYSQPTLQRISSESHLINDDSNLIINMVEVVVFESFSFSLQLIWENASIF